MLTAEQAALLMIVDPGYEPGPTMAGALQLAGLTDYDDKLTSSTVERLVRKIRRRIDEVSEPRPDCELHLIPIEGCCC